MAGGGGNPTKAILYAFWANLGIAVAKLVASIVTGSSSMMAEAIHSGSDTGNQLLLFLGLWHSKKAPTREHPLGFGQAIFFWSFIVAILLFSLGGLFSIHEGWQKLDHQGPVEHVWVALLVLIVSAGLEGGSLFGCLREVRALRGERGFWQWLQESRNAELIVVLGEDIGALLGLSLAILFLALAALTGNPVFDAWGSISIGVVLLVIAVFVAVRIHSLLIGRSADPEINAAIEEFIAQESSIESVYRVITLQLGPEILLAAKIRLRADLDITQACRQINGLERRLKERFPTLRWSFIEPDITD